MVIPGFLRHSPKGRKNDSSQNMSRVSMPVPGREVVPVVNVKGG